jgi:hypothetical protein
VDRYLVTGCSSFLIKLERVEDLGLDALTRSQSGNTRCSNTTTFYFTDNEVTYHVVTSGSSTSLGLHSLIHDIKMLELQLNCHVVCIHVPGTTISLQGADGLSRGVLISPLHARDSSRSILASLFAPVHPKTRSCG